MVDVSRRHALRIEGLIAQRNCLKRKISELELSLVEARDQRGIRQFFRRGSDDNDVTTPEPTASTGRIKPRISLIIDVADWAFANIADQLEKHLADSFDMQTIPLSELEHDPVLAAYLASDSDLIHHMFRDSITDAMDPYYSESVNLYFKSENALLELSKKTTHTVYDHLFLDEEEIKKRIDLFNDYSIGYSVSSNRLFDIYSNIESYPPPFCTTQDGVDLGLFRPSNIERLMAAGSRKLRVGWVGNSAWATDLLEDPKGFHSVLRPALDELEQDGILIDRVFADCQAAIIDHSAMPSYYNEIDVLVCASSIEGTPNPILEAMACGVPVISTDVGIVREVLGPKQLEFVLDRRSVDDLKSKLLLLAKCPEQLSILSTENLAQIQFWDWKRQAEKFRSFFSHALSLQTASNA